MNLDLGIMELDYNLFFYINSLSHPFLTYLAKFLSGVEGFGILWILLAVVATYIMRRQPKVIVATVTAVLVSTVVTVYILKPLVGRMRPYYRFPSAIYYSTDTDKFSFPSQHSSASFAAAAVIASVYPSIGIFVYLGAIAVGLSRIYLGLHFPSDVVIGAVLGFLIGFFLVKLFKLQKKRKRKT